MTLAAAVALTGCGTRAGDDEVRAGVATGRTVTLDQATLDQLRTAAEAGAGAGVGTTTTGVPATTGNVPAAGTTVTTTTGGRTKTGAAQAPATATGAAAGATTPAVTGRCTTQGTPLALGQIGSFSGVLGAITASARTSAAIWAQHANATGGLACHPVTVYAVDDGGDPSRAAAQAQDLITNKHVAALVAVFAPLSMPAITPIVTKYNVPVVGGDGVDPAWNSQPMLFPAGAGLDAMIEGSLRQVVQQGKTKLGLLYCVEASLCTSIAKTMPARAKAAGAEMVYQSAVSLTQTDFTAQCQNAKNAGVESFGMGVDGSAIARVARSCAALGYFPQFVSGGGVISPAQSEDPGIRHNTLSVSSGNAPWMLTDTAGQKEYAAALAQYSPGMQTDGNSMTAWASMELLEAAVGNLGTAAREHPLTNAEILTGLGKVKNETLGGLTPAITFSPGQKAAPLLHCVYFELLTDKGWTAPNGSKPVCSPGN
jgi:branched-chain amino acid transport system substrate-binding protein